MVINQDWYYYVIRVVKMIAKRQLSNSDLTKIQSYFTNPDLVCLAQKQINQIYADEISQQFTISLTAQGLHLFLYFHRIKKDLSSSQSQSSNSKQQEFGAYSIKITKSFPLSGVRVYILNNCFQPRIFDSRDIIQQILGSKWTHKNRLIQIIKSIDKFQVKLSQRNNQPLSMQKTGQFILNDLFDVHELKKFSALDIFKDHSRQDGPLLGVTQTHFLLFKQLPKNQKGGNKIYQLVRVCELQCISQIYVNEDQQIIITFNKYKTIKSFNEYDKISRKYHLDDSHQFIRNVLKNIGQFQKVQINLQMSISNHKNDVHFQQLTKRIEETKKLQKISTEQPDEQKRNKIYEQLIQNYHKIIDYFSERANAYYHIYVGKLNKIYSLKSAKE